MIERLEKGFKYDDGATDTRGPSSRQLPKEVVSLALLRATQATRIGDHSFKRMSSVSGEVATRLEEIEARSRDSG